MPSTLQQKIIDQIHEQGPIAFMDFMQQALYAPGLGYYSSGQQKFGAQGDFITAPELSPLFSHCIAYQCQQILSLLKSPCILECGAGSGVMAVDTLLMLEQLNSLPQQYFILELSAELQQRQKHLFAKRAPHLLSRISWLKTLPSQPFEGIVLANEVLDAMPVAKFRIDGNNLQEAYVAVTNNQFVWYWDKPKAWLSQQFNQLMLNLADGYESEINLLINGWIKSLGDCLSRGSVLLIDYGFARREYYHHDRSMGTLMCHYQHRAHTNPLIQVGCQDITAHVDFTAVASAAVDHGFDVAGYTHQAGFLVNCGITDLIQNMADATERFNCNNQIKQLTLPSEMGELFKVIALIKAVDCDELLGFRMFNQLERL